MAQQSARRGRKNQVYSSCLEHAFMIWSPVCELPYGPCSFTAASSEAGQMAASDYVPISFKNRLHLAGRPQMSTRPSLDDNDLQFISGLSSAVLTLDLRVDGCVCLRWLANRRVRNWA